MGRLRRRLLAAAAALVYSSYLGHTYYHGRRRGAEAGVHPVRLTLYKALLPTDVSSRVFGWLAAQTVPVGLRPLLYGSFARLFGCNVSESQGSLQDYPTFNAFFGRRLRPDSRPLDDCLLVSPCDGRVLHLGQIDLSRLSPGPSVFLEQIKGVTYPLRTLVGPAYDRLVGGRKKTVLSYCTIYLAPGDYHRFHAPAAMTVDAVHRFGGERLPVSPWFVRLAPRLFCLNERVVFSGQWRHGVLAVVPVGATNVGSVHAIAQPAFAQGQEMGHFEMGSTVVLLFQTPASLKLALQPGQPIKCGQRLLAE